MPSEQGQGNFNPEYREDLQNPMEPAVSARNAMPGDVYGRGPGDLPQGENPAKGGAGSQEQGELETADGEQSEQERTEAWLISKAHEIYTTSTDYVDANITNVWERNLAHFNNEHAPATKLAARNLKRSNVFRPKTRSMTKASEAALTNAMFSTADVLDIRAQDETDPAQIVSAAVNKEILSYRLDRQLPWYMTTIGAYQSTNVYGLCISFNYWKYEEDTDVIPLIDETGVPLVDEEGDALGEQRTIVRKDELACDLVAPENFRFDPMCDWRDPAGTSPYLLYMMPIYLGDALENMEKVDSKTGIPAWKRHNTGALLATRRKNYDRTRQAREGRGRVDPADQQQGNSYTTLWAHMNIVKVNGEDLVYWTMGTELLLTDPIPLMRAFPHLKRGQRPFTIGFSTVEAFRNYPAGDVELAGGIQEEINLVANQRLDNVKLVLNKRYYVRRGSQVDLDALIRNVPGGGVMMNDPEKDVHTVDTRDVTGSSYQEQDRLSVEMDELVGTFSQSSVQQTGNRKGGETKGGMDKVSSGAGAVRDYGLRIFFETWVEPTLRQLVQCIQHYEDDQVILSLAGNRSKMWQRYGIDKITDELLQQQLTVRVNVGVGNTDPQTRVEKLMFAVTKSAELPEMASRLKSSEVADEIFGTLGYKNSVRFFRNDSEQEQYLQENPQQPPPEIQLQQEEMAMHKEDNAARHQREVMKLEMTAQLGFAKLMLEKGYKAEQIQEAIRASVMKDKTERQSKALDNVIQLEDQQGRRQMELAKIKAERNKPVAGAKA